MNVETLHATSLLDFAEFLISGFYNRIWYYLQGSLLFAEGKYNEALEFLEKANTTQTHNLPKSLPKNW